MLILTFIGLVHIILFVLKASRKRTSSVDGDKSWFAFEMASFVISLCVKCLLDRKRVEIRQRRRDRRLALERNCLQELASAWADINDVACKPFPRSHIFPGAFSWINDINLENNPFFYVRITLLLLINVAQVRFRAANVDRSKTCLSIKNLFESQCPNHALQAVNVVRHSEGKGYCVSSGKNVWRVYNLLSSKHIRFPMFSSIDDSSFTPIVSLSIYFLIKKIDLIK